MTLIEAEKLTHALDRAFRKTCMDEECAVFIVEELNSIYPELYWMIDDEPYEVSSVDRIFGVQPRAKP